MTILRKATEQQQSDWLPVPEGLWRWTIREIEIVPNNYGKYNARFSLELIESERQRLTDEQGEPPLGSQQSWRCRYSVGLSLGFIDKNGSYQSTKLVDFLSACLGARNARRFRGWVQQGGGPETQAGMETDDELAVIGDWLDWWKGLEVYGTIEHAPNPKGGTWSNFTNPLAVGAIPGQPDETYQKHAAGKLQAMIAQAGAPATDAPAAMPQQQAIPPKAQDTAEEVFDLDEVPF